MQGTDRSPSLSPIGFLRDESPANRRYLEELAGNERRGGYTII